VASRIGCHSGPVVLREQDISRVGAHRNRMTSQAKAGQIILSARYRSAAFTGVRAVSVP